ncbi:unnamed protein product [Lactuca virosa]|uniref:Uncharacterized protein n=1 Tax=Lactuca virosa TaxID=75947 RepID=A0AAU9MIV1_9ASTR|nr:unnamed protein product [Lactuca virosa]
MRTLSHLQRWSSIRGNAFEPWFSKMGEHHNTFRGYIIMFVVLKPYRHRGIGIAEKGIKVCYSHANHSDRI